MGSVLLTNWQITVLLFGIPVLSIALCLGLIFAARSIPFFKRRRIQTGQPSWTQLWFEVRAMITCRIVDTLVYSALSTLFQFHFNFEASFGAGLALFAGLYLWFECWFYFVHRALHHPWFFRFHKHHHAYTVVTPLTAFSISAVERIVSVDLGLMIPLVAIGFFVPIPGYAYFTFMYGATIFDILGHCNIEFLPGRQKKPFPFGYMTDSTTHYLHHEQVNGNYGFSFQFLDIIFGSKLSARSAPPTV